MNHWCDWKNLKRQSPKLIWVGCLLYITSSLGLLTPKAFAQFQSPKDVAQAVYPKLPGFPLENQYVRIETNKQATDSTLISRFIQYHTTVKGRSPLYRLDWKITLADYLGVNDYLDAANYPGHAFLKTSPMEQDRAIVQKLNQTQRNLLIQALVNEFRGSVPSTSSPGPTPKPVSKTRPNPEKARPTLQPLATPGAADLLKPPPKPTLSHTGGEAQFLRP